MLYHPDYVLHILCPGLWRFCARRTGAGGRGGCGLRLPPLSSHPQRCRMTSRVRHGRMFALAAASAAAQHHPAAGECELQWPRSAGAPTLLGVISHGTTDRGGNRLLPQLAAPEVSCPGQPPAFAHPSALASPSQAPSPVSSHSSSVTQVPAAARLLSMAYKQAPSGASIGTGGDWAVRVARWPDYGEPFDASSPRRRLVLESLVLH